jgi:hypothetical protein
VYFWSIYLFKSKGVNELFCKCGNKITIKGDICKSCKEKVDLLNRIRQMLNLPSNEKSKPKHGGNERYFQSHSTLCWKCQKASGGCSWSRDFIPVDGWEAKPSQILIACQNQTKDKKPKYTESFDVHSCPEFELLDMLR